MRVLVAAPAAPAFEVVCVFVWVELCYFRCGMPQA